MSEKNEWKPIESAPKDGTEIIVFHPQAGVCAAFCPGDGFAWHCMDGMNTGIGKKSGQSIPIMTSFVEPPTHWQPLPAAPGSTPSAPGDAQDERQAFEAWMTSQGLGFLRDGDSYSLTFARRAWEAWQARARVAAPAAGDARRPDFERAEKIASDFVQDYEWRGEDVAGRDTCYTPNKRERAMLTDAILGVLAEPAFIAALTAQQQEGSAAC